MWLNYTGTYILGGTGNIDYLCVLAIYRLLKHVDDKRVLFLVDTLNLGEPASVLLERIKKDKAHEKQN